MQNTPHITRTPKRLNFRSGCSFCAELSGHPKPWHQHFIPEAPLSRILYETPMWVVIPTIGPLVPGHILIVSKNHADSILATDKEEIDELELLLGDCITKLSNIYGVSCAVFEHGMDSTLPNLSGACIDHAHLHVLPCKENLVAHVQNELPDWVANSSLRGFHDRRLMGTYLLAGSTFEKSQFCFHTCREPTPSQYLRKLVADMMGIKSNWNWRENPNGPDFFQTIYDWNRII